MLLRPFRDFYNHLLPVLSIIKVTAHHINILPNALIIRSDKGKITSLVKNPHHLIISVSNNAQNFALWLLAMGIIIHTRQNTVVIHRSVQGSRRNENIGALALIIWNNKAKALTGQLKTPCHQTHFFGKAVGLKACLNNLAVLLQG